MSATTKRDAIALGLAALAVVIGLACAMPSEAAQATRGPSIPTTPTKQPDPTPTTTPTPPSRMLPDRMIDTSTVNAPASVPGTATYTPRKAILNRLENRSAADRTGDAGTSIAKKPEATPAARQLLESAKPIL